MNSIFYPHTHHSRQNSEQESPPTRREHTAQLVRAAPVETSSRRAPGIRSSASPIDTDPLVGFEKPVDMAKVHITPLAKKVILSILFVVAGLLLLSTFVRWSTDSVSLAQVPSMISYYNGRLTVCASNYAITRDAVWIRYYNGNASTYYHYIHGLKWMLNDYSHTNFMASFEDIDHSLRSTEQLVIQGGIAPDSNFPLAQVSYQYNQHMYQVVVEALYENIDASVSSETTFYGTVFVLSEFLLACAILVLCTRIS